MNVASECGLTPQYENLQELYDQFGGEKGKKMKYKPFKNFLISNSKRPLDEQSKFLASHFEDWRGEHEQIDDVCLFGMKIN